MSRISPAQALDVLCQVKAKFMATGIDHDTIGVAIQTLREVVEDHSRLQRVASGKRVHTGAEKERKEEN